MKKLLYVLLAVFVLLPAVSPVHAQASPGGSSAGLDAISQAAKRPDDKSRAALVGIFGQVVNDPLASNGIGGGDTILAAIFQRTNAVLLTIAIVIAGWGLFRKIERTARSGSVFDKATMWSPLRMVWGVSALVPTANGWSVAQLTMLWAASIMGIGTANIAVDAGAQALKSGTPLVMQPAMPQTLSIARQIFESDLCMHSVNYGVALVAQQGGLTNASEYVNQVPVPGGFVLTDAHHRYSCGGATVDESRMQPQQITSSLADWTTFDVSQIYQAHEDALALMQRTLEPAAKAYVQSLLAVRQGQVAAAVDPQIAIQSAAAAYENTVQARVGETQGNMRDLSDHVVDSLSKQGWWMLGSWYQTFAMANTRMNDAVKALAIVRAPSPIGEPSAADLWHSNLAAFRASEASSTVATAISNQPSGPQAAAGAGDANSLFSTIFSPGQSLLRAMTGLNAGDASGARGQVNPLIRLKNMGDYTLGMAETALGVVVGLSVVNELKGNWSIVGIAAKVGNLVTGIGDAYTGTFKAVYPYVFIMICALFLFGLTLSVYLPMVPFITWFGAILNWLIVVAEGVVAASLWAMAHLLEDGEGMGSRSLHGYLYLLNVIIRPFLMVIGFFIGGGVLTVGGTFLVDGFGVAVANAQFDSITGIISILGFYWIFIQLCLTLVHSSFNLVLILPDRVITWLGGSSALQFGTDTNDRSHSAFNQGKEKAGHTHDRGSDRAARGSERQGALAPGGNGITQ